VIRQQLTRRPEAVLLVHGAGSGPWVFEPWKAFFPGSIVTALDLQQGLRAERASMDLYAGTVIAEAGRLPWPLLLVGWSMGGLVAMIAARTLRPETLVLLEPSPPAEVAGTRPEVEIPDSGVYDPEEVYGPLPDIVRSRPESSRARAERLGGISVPELPGRTIVVYGDEFTEGRGRAIARHYGCEELHLPGLSHLDLVMDLRVPKAISRLAGIAGDEPS
jgi:pimeloyl-ACP methyl ester carboxylesterase